jgi:F-type H+-transporting ATPase subunit delta
MARSKTSSRRYAEAAFEIALRDGTVDQWLDQLQRAAGIVSDQAQVRRLENPRVPFGVRRDALAAAIGPDVMPQVTNLMGLVLRRRRLDRLPALATEFRRLYNRRAGIVEATATSAVELGPDDITALRERLGQLITGTIELHTRVDPSLLGGVQVRLGDQLIDGSVRGRLERLRSQLAARA